MPRTIRIGDRHIGDGAPVFIIAEAGSNHNGSYTQALQLIDVAAEAGADAVKFQTFKAERLYPRSAGRSEYLNDERPIFEIIRQMEMPEAWVPKLADHCRARAIEFMSTPFDEASADLLAPHVNVFKIASYEMTHTPLLRHVARLGKPIIVSTGTAELREVVEALDVIRREGNDAIVACQCTASYPAPPEDINVRSLVQLRDATGALVGLSDHSRDPIIAPVAAVAIGACVVEKHFTLSNALPGPDHRFAVEPEELRTLVASVRTAERMLGHGRKELLASERELHAFARRSIFAMRPIRAGERLSADSVGVLRCGRLGYGLDPDQYDHVLGRVARRDIPAESLIRLSDLES